MFLQYLNVSVLLCFYCVMTKCSKTVKLDCDFLTVVAVLTAFYSFFLASGKWGHELDHSWENSGIQQPSSS